MSKENKIIAEVTQIAMDNNAKINRVDVWTKLKEVVITIQWRDD